MRNLDKLIALSQRTGLLDPTDDDAQRKANAVAFTHLAAAELAELGFAAIKSTEKDDTHGIKAGFLVGRETREHIRIIANIDTPNQIVVWEELPLAGKDVQHVPPVDLATNPALQGAIASNRELSKAGSKKTGHKSGDDKEGKGAHAHG